MKTILLLMAMITAFTVSAQLNPDFSPHHDVVLCGPNDVYFVCVSPENPANIWWDFGDGTTGTGKNPVHNYSTTGSYDVKMIVEKNGVKDSITKVGFVQLNPVPECSFEVDSSQTLPQAFKRKFVFTGFANADSIVQYTWTVNEVAVGSGQTLVYTFPGNGDYVISLTVVNNTNCSDQYTETVTVADDPDLPMAVRESQNPFSASVAFDQSQLLIKRNRFVDERAAVSLHDISGRLLKSFVMMPGESSNIVSMNDLPNGAYIVNISSKSNVAVKRFSKVL